MRTLSRAVFLAIILGLGGCASKNSSLGIGQSDADIQKIGEEAYVYGYPLVLMSVTEDVLTRAERPTNNAAPINQFAHRSEFPDADFTGVVTPNVDTLYSSAWLDLAKEPIILSVPATGKRFYMMQMMDAWTNVFASPGTRTTGNGKGSFAITGPNWSGKLPKGVVEIKSPTDTVWIIGRTQASSDKKDQASAAALQKQYKLTPLSAWGTNYIPPKAILKEGVNVVKAPVDQVSSMSGVEFFQILSRQMNKNPQPVADQEVASRLKRILVGSGESFNPERFSKSQLEALNRAAKNGENIIKTSGLSISVTETNNWRYSLNTGNYGTDYKTRAFIAMTGLGANLPQDAVYPRIHTDSANDLLMGGNRYTITFDKGNLPPARAFWSITVYDSRNFLVANPINRYSLGDRDKVKYNKDGSLTLYLQHDEPDSSKIANWLPIPDETFNLVMRLYWPRQIVLDGKWQIPEVRRTVGSSSNLSMHDKQYDWQTGDEEN